MSNSNTRRMIEQRRRQENAYRDMDSVVAADRRQLQIAKFEIATTDKIDRRRAEEEFKKSKLRKEEILMDRRQKLAALYNYEMNSWKEELLSQVESQEDRKKRIMEKAYALRDAREKERQRVIQEAYDRQWRDACDDARTLDSEALKQYMLEQRRLQIEEKMRARERLTQEEMEYIATWKNQLKDMNEQETRIQQLRKEAEMKTKSWVSDQIVVKKQQQELEFNKRREEENQMLAEVRQKMLEDEENMRRRQEDALRRGQEIRNFNETHKQYLEREKERQSRQESLLLNYALEQEKAQIAAEQAKKEANKNAGKQYKQYLEQMMQKEAEDNAYLDDICRQEEERVWKAREEALQAREDARKQLQSMVLEGREQQIREKEERRRREAEENNQYTQYFIEQAKEGIAQEREEIERGRRIEYENKQLLKQHIDLRKEKSALEKQQEYLQVKEMEYMEKLHQDRLRNQGGIVRLKHPIRTGPKW